MTAISVKILIFFTILKLSASEIQGNSIKALAKCVIEEVKKDFNYQPTIVIKTIKNNVNKNNIETANRIIREANLNNIPLIILKDLYLIPNDSTHGNFLHTLILNEEDCNKLAFMNFNMKKIKYLIIYLGEYQHCDFKAIDKQVITNDITIMAQGITNEEFIFINAIFEINETTCTITDEVTYEKINTCVNGSFVKRQSVFPKKALLNFKKCPLNTGIGELYPYMMLVQNKTINYQNFHSLAESDIRGSDVDLLKLISNHFNATIYFYYIVKEQENPFANKDFIALVVNGSLDVCAGGLYRIYGDIVEYSGVYTRQAVIWAYSVERDIRSWESFIGKMNGLYLFFIFYIIHVIVWKIICTMDKSCFAWGKTLVYTWGALVGTTSLQDARTIKQKIVNGMYLILALHLSAYLSVQLYSYLTIQSPPKMYRSIDELMDSGIKPYLKPRSKYFIKDRKYEAFANTSGDCESFQHCQEIILEKKGTTALIDGYMPIYQLSTAVNDEARVIQLNEDIIFVYHEMVIRKDMFIGDAFRKTILHLFEAGICNKMYGDNIGMLLNDRARAAAKNVMSNSYSCQSGCAITLLQSAGAFYFWISGCILSSLVFIVEIIVERYKLFSR